MSCDDMTESSQEISLSDIFEAKERVKGILEPTLCAKTCFLEEFNIEVILKEENLSPTGSWFDRAVLNTLLSLSETKLQALEFAKRTGLEVIDSDHSHTMLVGLCTLGLEITEQCGPNLDAILVPYKCPSILTELRCFARCMLPHVEIIGVHLKTKKITRGEELKSSIVNFGTKGTGRQASFKRLVYCSQTVQTNSGNLH
ncbi:hypothetical protein P5673_005725 [Acropora cervicornis]|uniref:Uncharacterized protein n=1 Tax=Acropora cervicornis TaxID=6130 RepID=A0AAD9VDF8_ACRCE|nr:hypothetical protein P5673_005725 [Acropora cervicornis]